MPNVLGRKLFKKQSSRGKGITSMLEDFPQGFAEGGEVTSPTERKRLAMDMLARAREEGFSFFEEGERPSLTRQAAVGGAPAMGPDPRAAQQLAMMQQLGMMPPRFQQGGLNDLTDAPGMMSGFETSPMMEVPRGTPVLTPSTSPSGQSQLSRDIEGLVKRQGEVAESRGRSFFGGLAQTRRDLEEAERIRSEALSKRPPGSTVGDYFRTLTPEEIAEREAARAAAEAKTQAELERLRTVSSRGGFPEVTEDPFEARQQAGFEGGRAEAMRNVPRREEPETKKETPPPPAAGGDRPGVSLPATSGIDVLIEDIKARREGLRATRDENKAMALIQAGLAIASGRSANALSNIGAGGLAGIQALREGERDIRREQRELSSDEMRLALAREQAGAERAYREATLGLRREELTAMDDLRKAQAEAFRARPGLEMAQIEQRRRAAMAQARIAAEKAVDDMIKANPMQFMTPKGTIDLMKRDIEVSRRYNAVLPSFMQGGGGGTAEDPLGLRSTITPSGE